MKKNIFCGIIYIGIIIVIAEFIKYKVFHNTLDNQAWAGFLGGYLGGAATLAAVFITISDNNRKLKKQQIETSEKELKQKEELYFKEHNSRKQSIRPYLDTRFNFIFESCDAGINDRIFDLKGENVLKVRYRILESDNIFIENSNRTNDLVVLKYYIRNVGAGSAVNMKIYLNQFPCDISIAKDEEVNLYLFINFNALDKIHLNFKYDYWDVDEIGHYYQEDSVCLCFDEKEELCANLGLHTRPIEINSQ